MHNTFCGLYVDCLLAYLSSSCVLHIRFAEEFGRPLCTGLSLLLSPRSDQQSSFLHQCFVAKLFSVCLSLYFFLACVDCLVHTNLSELDSVIIVTNLVSKVQYFICLIRNTPKPLLNSKLIYGVVIIINLNYSVVWIDSLLNSVSLNCTIIVRNMCDLVYIL